VCFHVPNYAPSIGGAQSHVRRVAEGLAARHGHEVEVVTTDALSAPGGRHPGQIPTRYERLGGVSVRRFPVARHVHGALRTVRRIARRLRLPEPRWLTVLAFGPLGLRWVIGAWRRSRVADVVVGVAAPFLTLALAERSARGTSTAVVAMPLLHLSGDRIPPWIPATIARGDGSSCSTTVEGEWLVDHGVVPSRLAYLPPGCDPERYPDLEPGDARRRLGLPDRPTVGYVGRLAAHKGIDTLLESASLIWRSIPDVTILIAGGRAGWEGLDDLIAATEATSAGRVVIRPDFAEEERAVLLAACDVVIFVSREESFGMVTLESWCARRPVVVGDLPAVRCVVRDGDDALVVPVGDPLRLAEAVLALLRDPGTRRRLGAAGRRRTEDEFRWDTIIDGWDSFLRRAVDRHRSQAVA
jgi:phosphatidylinositol alpha-1,6-mannosyltransferase